MNLDLNQDFRRVNLNLLDLFHLNFLADSTLALEIRLNKFFRSVKV